MASDSWQLTILLLSGLRLMRPEKAWRPIVTVEVENGGARAGGVYETLLGVDGQCVNQRDSMTIYDAAPTARVEICIWHRSQSKKKKRRVLVASASCCLAELAKKQEGNADGKVELRLTCRSVESKTSSAARGRPQNGAVLRLKVRPPRPQPIPSQLSAPTIQSSASTATLRPASSNINAEAGPSRSSTLDTVYTDDSHASMHADAEGSSQDGALSSGESDDAKQAAETEKSWLDDDLITFDDPAPLLPQEPQQTLRRRRRVKGYALYTDDECLSVSASGEESETDALLAASQRLKDDDVISNTFVDDDDDGDDDMSVTPHPTHLTLSFNEKRSTSLSEELVFRASTGEIISFSSTTTETGEKVWIAPARDMLLPIYTEKVVLPPQDGEMMLVERVLATFTLYAEMRAAQSESDFEPVMRRLQNEWAVVGTLLLALAGVNTAMFTVDSGGMFTVNEAAQIAVATSSVSSGLGIACTAWFFLRYNWADISTFISRSRDLFGAHFFFALSARVPALCMFISACALTTCLALIAFATFPNGVVVLCFLVGMLMSLQFIVFGVSWLGKQVVTGGRAGGERVRGVVKRVRSMTGGKEGA